ncbi:hypothetical protein QJQ45_020118 [Haematococcus lacustris]|nr:hypothetical protein QJQ45_020118 [Haematococcus lacustris]
MNGLMLRGPRPGAAVSAGQPAVTGPSAGLRRGSLAVARYAKSPVSDECAKLPSPACKAPRMNTAVTAALSALLLFNSTAGPVPLAQAAPDTFVGTARVVDGDTLYIGSEKFRLYGVDAPETKQTCTDGVGQSYACGLVAKDALTQKIGNQPVSCKVRERDQYGRGVAVCSLAPGGVMGMVSGGAGAEELNSWLVKNGLAVAYREYGKDYIPVEEGAKAAKKGVWAGAFQYPATVSHQGGCWTPLCAIILAINTTICQCGITTINITISVTITIVNIVTSTIVNSTTSTTGMHGPCMGVWHALQWRKEAKSGVQQPPLLVPPPSAPAAPPPGVPQPIPLTPPAAPGNDSFSFSLAAAAAAAAATGGVPLAAALPNLPSLPPGLPLPLPNQGIVLSAPSAASPAAIIPAPPLFCGPGVKPVKGNISGKGEKIYHLPGGAYYDKVLIEPEKGEQYFCTEQQAIAAGYRAAGTPQGGAAKVAPKPAAGK